MAWAYVYMKVSEYPSSNPLGLHPLPLPFSVYLLNEPKFWLNWQKIYYPSPDWSSVFCDCSTKVLSIAYTAHIRFVCYTSFTHISKSVSWPFFVHFLFVTHALLMHFMRSLHVLRRPSSPCRRLSSPDEHWINIFSIFSVRSEYITVIR